jgi:hypothetical protein
MDSGVAVSAILIFFILQYPKDGTIGATNVQVWWGNMIWTENADYLGTALNVLGPNEYFGPANGTW